MMNTIESRRFALLVAAGIIGFLLYQAWHKDFPAQPPPVSAPAAAPLPEGPAGDDLPVAAEAPGVGSTAPASAPVGEVTAPAAVADTRVRVRTDVMAVELSTQGGDIRRLELLDYRVDKKRADEKVALLDDQPERWFVVQSGLAATGEPLVSHRDAWRAAATDYVLADGADALAVPLEFSDAQGRRVTKTYVFHRGSYVVDLKHRLVNGGEAPVSVNPYVQMWRTEFKIGEDPPFIPTWMGLGLYQQKDGSAYRFHKVKFEKLPEEPVKSEQTGGWIAMLQHYFLAAVIPPQDEAVTLVGKPSSTRGFLAQAIGAGRTVAPGETADFGTTLYIGPNLQRSVGKVAPGLELTVDYGLLTPVAEPLFWLLDWFHKLTGNWGAAIILLTFAVKLAMYKLSEAQYRGMAKMKKYAPRIQELKERYGDDRERMHKAMMELYQKEKFNPLAGCWPLLFQFPVFISLYWVLLQSVELRQADFALWLNDLSAPDPFYVLPVLFGVTMFVQQKLSGNVAMDPMQQRVMNIMPVMLTVFFAFFPVGLVLYWLVSNLIGIAQQWYITRKLDAEGLRR